MEDRPRRCPLSLVAGQHLEGNPDYIVVHPNGRDDPQTIPMPVGGGGAGVVYRMLYKDLVERAVKFLCPRSDIDVDFDRFKENFDDEIATLARITHTHIAKILDLGFTSFQDTDVPFFAMEYIDGENFNFFWSRDECTSQIFLELCDQVLLALNYLHNSQPPVMHSDIKGANIRVVKQGNTYSAILLDLGAAHVILPKSDGLKEFAGREDVTYFFSTKSVTHPAFRQHLGEQVSRTDIASMFPHQDLYAFGALLNAALQNPRLKNELSESLDVSGLLALEAMTDRLLDSDLTKSHYRSVVDLHRDWQKLLPGYLSPLEIDELSLSANIRELVTTPLGRIPFTLRVERIVRHPLFQRLQHIPQLELLAQVYPGATHTRYQHSLNTFEVAKQYVSHLLNDSTFRLLINPSQIEATLFLALLHDIGHYPLSHMFEDFGQEQRDRGDKLSPADRILDDEELFWSFVQPDLSLDQISTGFYSGIIDGVLSNYPVQTKGKVDKVAALHEVISSVLSERSLQDMKDIVYPISESAKILRGIMSSPIDADKVSYLSLDSKMTGVPYGSGMDLDALFASLRVPSLADIRSEDESIIAINEKGISAAESVVMARYWMLNRVYWYRENRALMSMVKFAIGTLRSHNAMSFADYFERTLFMSGVEALNMLSNMMNSVDPDMGVRKVTNPVALIASGNTFRYERLYTVTHSRTSIEEQIYEKLAFKRSDELEELTEEMTQAIERVLGAPNSLGRGDVLIDVPVKRRKPTDKVLVYFRDSQNSGQDLFAGSPVLYGLSAAFDRFLQKCRVFVHPAVFEQLGPAEKQAQEAVGQILKDFVKNR